MPEFILCGSCCHDHDALNDPTGCCETHGPFMYFCADCATPTPDENGDNR